VQYFLQLSLCFNTFSKKNVIDVQVKLNFQHHYSS